MNKSKEPTKKEIQIRMIEKGYTVQSMADELGKDKSSVSNAIAGRRKELRKVIIDLLFGKKPGKAVKQLSR